MRFMSQEHVDEMNRLLAAAPGLPKATATLDRRYVLLYDLPGGPDGEHVYWRLTVGPGEMEFGLEPVDVPDVRLSADWSTSMQALISRTADEDTYAISGDLEGLALVEPIVAWAHTVAAIPAEMPQL